MLENCTSAYKKFKSMTDEVEVVKAQNYWAWDELYGFLF